MFNIHDISRDAFQLTKGQAEKGYDWWWHSFTARDAGTEEEKPFFIEFYVCNPARGEDHPVFGQLKENREKGIRPSYLMVKAGTWGEDACQIHRFFGIREAEIGYGTPFSIHAGDCFLNETETRGSVSVTEEESREHPEWFCESGSMEWHLKIRKKTAFNVGYGAGRLFRSLQLFEMFWHAEGMKTEYEGEVIWNGRKYTVAPETCYGYADKNWGKDFTSPWVWLSSCSLTDRKTKEKMTDSVFDIGGGCPKAGPIALKRRLLSAFFFEGKQYEFNFSKFWTNTKTVFDCRETDTQIIWHVEQKTWRNRMVTDVTCEKKDMLLIRYEAPDGQMRHTRLWNGGNGKGTVLLFHDGKLTGDLLCDHTGCEYGEYDAVIPYTK